MSTVLVTLCHFRWPPNYTEFMNVSQDSRFQKFMERKFSWNAINETINQCSGWRKGQIIFSWTFLWGVSSKYNIKISIERSLHLSSNILPLSCHFQFAIKVICCPIAGCLFFERILLRFLLHGLNYVII